MNRSMHVHQSQLSTRMLRSAPTSQEYKPGKKARRRARAALFEQYSSNK